MTQITKKHGYMITCAKMISIPIDKRNIMFNDKRNNLIVTELKKTKKKNHLHERILFTYYRDLRDDHFSHYTRLQAIKFFGSRTELKH